MSVPKLQSAGLRAVFSALLLSSATLWCHGAVASEGISFSGYYKNYLTAFKEPGFGKAPGFTSGRVLVAVNARLRLSLSADVKDWLAATLAYDLAPRVGERTLLGDETLVGGIDIESYRAVDLDQRLYPGEGDDLDNLAVFHNLDRALLTISFPVADLYLGRQPIAWGSARAVNPTDVLAPFAYNELDVEDRRGVDAIRVRAPLGMLGELDAGYVCGVDCKLRQSAIFLRSRFYYYHTDVTMLAVEFRENLLLGFDLTRAIGGAGTWIEGAYTFVGALSTDTRREDQDYFRASLGGDYVLRNGTYIFAEYHYSQAGSDDPAGYLELISQVSFTEGGVYLLGEHYLILGAARQANLLLSFSGEIVANLTDRSLLLAPRSEYNIAENVYLAGGAYLGLGKEPSPDLKKSQEPPIDLRSEFGSYSDIYFLSLRVYF